MNNSNGKLSHFVPLTDNEQVSMETLLSAEWVHGIEYGFDDVRYDEPSEEILYSEEALSGLLIEEEGNLYHASHRTAVPQKESVTSASPSNELLMEKEVAERLGVSCWTVRRWRVKGDLPFIRLKPPSRRVFYRMDTVLEWLHQREVDAVVEHQGSETKFVSVL